MVNEIIIAILIIVFFIAIKENVKHFKGQGGCCGGGSTVKARKKRLNGPILGRYVITIEGMKCENCKNRIEGKVNDLEGVSCRVNLHKKTAVITYNRDITQEEICHVIEKIGYTAVPRCDGKTGLK